MRDFTESYIASLNKTVSDQARLTRGAEENTIRTIEQLTQTLQATFKDLPFSLFVIFMTAIYRLHRMGLRALDERDIEQ
jgi:hypothetical protein